MPTKRDGEEDDEMLEKIRAAARARVEASSLRTVAKDLDFSPTGLSKFLDGSRPYTRRFRRLKAWYVREGFGPIHLSPGDARAALALLTAGMEHAPQTTARQKIVQALAEGFAENPPWWLRHLASSGGESA